MSFVSAHTGNEIDLSVASGSTTTGVIKDFTTLSGSLGSTISGSKIFIGGNTTLGNTVIVGNGIVNSITASGGISSSGKLKGSELHLNDLIISGTTGGDIFFKNVEVADSYKFLGDNNAVLLQIGPSVNQTTDGLQITQGVGKFTLQPVTSTDNITVSARNAKLQLQTAGSTVVTITGSTMHVGGTTEPPEKLTVVGNISSSGFISTDSHITASGNISSSGTLISNEINTIGNITASGEISSSGVTNALRYTVGGITNSLINSSGRLGVGVANNLTTQIGKSSATPLLVRGNITASGDISASGTISVGSTITSTAGNLNLEAGRIILSAAGDPRITIGANNRLTFGVSSALPCTFHTPVSASGFISTDSNITASGDISSSGDITGDRLFLDRTIEANGGVTAGSFTTTGNTIFGNAATDTHTFTGHITASGNIKTGGILQLTSSAFVAGGQIQASGSIVSSAGIQSRAVNITATDNGSGSAQISPDTSVALINADSDANHIVVLPQPIIGNIIHLIENGTTGYELRTSNPAVIGINGGTANNAESAIAGAITYVKCVAVSNSNYICSQFDADGDESKVEAAS